MPSGWRRGHCCSPPILPAGDRRSTLHNGVTTIPVDGYGPCQVVAVTRVADPNRLTASFHETAAALKR